MSSTAVGAQNAFCLWVLRASEAKTPSIFDCDDHRNQKCFLFLGFTAVGVLNRSVWHRDGHWCTKQILFYLSIGNGGQISVIGEYLRCLRYRCKGLK